MRIVSIFSLLASFSLLAAENGPQLKKIELFQAGTGDYTHYRIPGIVVTSKGTLFAYCEARKDRKSDWGEIDVLARRSVDGGRSWSSPVKIFTPPSDARKNPVALRQNLGSEQQITVNNPVAIADKKNGIVHFLCCLEYSRCFYLRSEDDGATFSSPVEITAVFDSFRPEYDWKVLATGPGHGIQLSSGRLLVPVWLSTGTGGHAHRPSCVSTIFSDNQGRTWQRGEIVVGHPTAKNPGESTAVELADGRVMLNIRHESRPRGRGVAISPDGSAGWTPFRFDDQLPEPICMASLVRLSTSPPSDRNRILFSNPDNRESTARRNLTIRVSYDEGQTWPISKPLETGWSGYSDLAVGRDSIWCFYERPIVEDNRPGPLSLWLARFNLKWLEPSRSDVDKPR